jgi:glycerol-3-phosphate dehydrogenase subunit B
VSRVVVIGAGLAGLTAALRLAEGGADVTVVARGTGALHLSPGTIDVLGYAPGRVEAPRAGVAALLDARPGHPYAHVGDALEDAIAWFAERVPGMRYTGDGARNLLLPTAVGVPRPTALAPASMAAGDLRGGGRFVAVGLAALKDFFPRLLADNLAKADLGGAGVATRHAEIDVSPRPDEADVAAQVFARALDDRPDLRVALAGALAAVAEPGETILMPAVLGLRAAGAVWDEVQERAGVPVAEVATVPPSVPGMRLNTELAGAVAAAGGRIRLGPEAVGCEGADGRISAVLVRDAARTRPLAADAVVLATGGFASGGLELDSHGGLRETALGLPVSGPPAGAEPLSVRHLDHQPLMTAGVSVDEGLRPTGADGAVVWANLRAAGSIVAGAEPWREKSGEGIAIAGGYRAAGAILEET